MDFIKDFSTILGLVISIVSVLGIFTGIVNKMFSKKLKPIEDRLFADETENTKNQMNNLRYRVVTFANDLHNGIKHSRYEFEIIFTFIDGYEQLVEKLGVSNNYFSEECRYITEQYRELVNSTDK